MSDHAERERIQIMDRRVEVKDVKPRPILAERELRAAAEEVLERQPAGEGWIDFHMHRSRRARIRIDFRSRGPRRARIRPGGGPFCRLRRVRIRWRGGFT